MSLRSRIILVTVFLLVSLVLPLQPTSAQGPVVRAVLFYSPTCPVCHEIMGEVLPPLMEQYSGSLQIVNVDVTTPLGQSFYQEAIRIFQITENRIGVPTLIVGDIVMVGRYEIPDYFPTMIQTGLAAQGFDWPGIPGLAAEIADGSFEFFGAEGSFGYEVSLWERFNQDPLANSLSVIVLGGMLYSVYKMLGLYYSSGRKQTPDFPEWVIPVVALIGLGVAIYLSFIEVSHAEAFCGPVGNCNLVQQSDYSKLFGVIPVGILGTIAYVILLVAWAVQRFGREDVRRQAVQLMWLVTVGGTLFSIYLTFLEPFVIGATCIWCITSAIAMTALFWMMTYRSIDLQSRSKRKSRRG